MLFRLMMELRTDGGQNLKRHEDDNVPEEWDGRYLSFAIFNKIEGPLVRLNDSSVSLQHQEHDLNGMPLQETKPQWCTVLDGSRD
jgi:hypothetical protein